MKIIRINDLDNLPDQSPDYVTKQLDTRINDISKLPKEAIKMLSSHKTLFDIGPGEGISSMAIASLFPELTVSGFEMDQKHLVGAWPTCSNYKNLTLYFGALPGTPSNQNIDHNIRIPQLENIDADLLFSWTGISRKDLFEHTNKWHHVVNKGAILIVPKFWREGLDSLKENHEIKSLLRDLESEEVSWQAVHSISEFSSMEVYPLNQTLKARGWILWLSGIFDNLDISFWNTLTDRWREKVYQLESIELPLEMIVLRK